MHCWARYLFYAVVTVLAIGQMLAACGQVGDLYLPDEAASKTAPQATPTATATLTPTAATPTAATPSQPRMIGTDGEGLEAIDDIPDATPGPVSPQAEGL